MDSAKLNAARAVFEEVGRCEVIGVGTGSTVEKFIELLSKQEHFKGKLYVPSSIDTALKLSERGFRVLNLLSSPEVEVYVDGADEVDPRLNMIKGGGAAMTMEKILAHYAARRLFIVDYTKLVARLGEKHPIPVEVLPCALSPVLKTLHKMGFRVELRASGRGKAGPVVADTGGVVIDVYTGPLDEPEEVNRRLKSIPGVVETGLFLGYADAVYVGWPDKVEVLKPSTVIKE